MRFPTLAIILIIWISNIYKGSTTRKPKIKHESKRSFYVNLNDTVRLPCRPKRKFDGKARIVYYWKKESVPIPVHKSRHHIVFDEYLQITNIHSYDHGNYTCVAMNMLGKDVSKFQLFVMNRNVNITSKSPLEPTSITPFPLLFKDYLHVITKVKKKFYRLNKQAKLKCLVKGSPAPSVKWYHNGKWLSKTSRIHTSKKGKVLKIRKFSLADVGSYVCFASNGKGTINMTVIAHHYKTYSPSKVKVTIEARPGENITLRCQVSSPKMSYLAWVLPENFRPFNKKPLTIDLQRKALVDSATFENTTKQFVLHNANASIHDGTYLCRGAFVNSDRFFTIKEYTVKIVSDAVVTATSSSNRNLVVVLGVLPALVTICFVACICFRCHKKQSKQSKSPEIPKCNPDDDEGDTMSLHILPKDPHGQLTVHVNEAEHQYASNIIYSEIGTLERRVKIVKDNSKQSLEHDKISFQSDFPPPISQQEYCEHKSEMSLPKMDRLTKNNQRYSLSSYSWPGRKSQFDDGGLDETEKLYKENTSKQCRDSNRTCSTYRTDRRDDHLDDEDLSDDSDNLLNREKRKWEALIVQGRDKNDNYQDMERTRLLCHKVITSTIDSLP